MIYPYRHVTTGEHAGWTYVYTQRTTISYRTDNPKTYRVTQNSEAGKSFGVECEMTAEDLASFEAVPLLADKQREEEEGDSFPVVCDNGCPEGYLGRHKFSCSLARPGTLQ